MFLSAFSTKPLIWLLFFSKLIALLSGHKLQASIGISMIFGYQSNQNQLRLQQLINNIVSQSHCRTINNLMMLKFDNINMQVVLVGPSQQVQLNHLLYTHFVFNFITHTTHYDIKYTQKLAGISQPDIALQNLKDRGKKNKDEPISK